MKWHIDAVFFEKDDMENAFRNFSNNLSSRCDSEVVPYQNGMVFTLGKKGDTDMTVSIECHFKMIIEWKDDANIGVNEESIVKTITDNKGLLKDMFIKHL